MKLFFQEVINECLEGEFLIDKHNGYGKKVAGFSFSFSHDIDLIPKEKKLLIIEMYHR